METTVSGKSHRMLFFNTLAFTICFAVWTFNGVMITFLVDNGVYNFSSIQIGWLLGIPILTGSIFRLPLGMLTDKYGGKWIFLGLLLFCAIPMYMFSMADSFTEFVLCSLGFGMAGTGFAIGIANTSVWYPKEWQGRALGIFGVGNAGAALTTLLAPTILNKLTNGNAIENWRILPQIYAISLIIMAILFFFFTENKKHSIQGRSMKQLLQPLKSVRVWRFGLYYFLVFGFFVAISQWLVPYFVNVYAASLVTAGLLASIFSLPSGIIRALGGWLSDKFGGRAVMKWVFIISVVTALFLSIPRMEIFSPGKSVMAAKKGKITFVSDKLIKVDNKEYPVIERINKTENTNDDAVLILPTKQVWQVPSVKVGDTVVKKQILAKGETKIYFQANMWVFVVLVFIIGIVWGIGKAGVYKLIPDYFPNEIGVVGGMVGVIGGLGGFFGPIIFGYLLEWSGLWTSCWIFLLILSVICLWWMNKVVKRLTHNAAPEVANDFEHK
ncbi:MAG: NarK/NasA family nitrate transporter [Bacteroidia bacterium]|nr:NarK/NasA family nitrate transporter [Bacteroidia bacterium]